jgi:SNF2 family DNA or RNA helicase
VELSLNQKRLYNSLKKEVVAEFNGKTMSAPLALTKMMRLQQIIGGFFTPDANQDAYINSDEEDRPVPVTYSPQPIDEVNLRVESLIELLEEVNGKVIIWARFRAEISAITKRIHATFGRESCVEYHGGIANEDRSLAVTSFQNNPDVRFFVGHVQAGGKGLTLHAATTVVYYSNNFSLEDRLQSEDRCHRIGQKNNVTYIDMIAPHTLDDHVVKALRDKKNVADLITGDTPIEHWL